jgi:hydrogenase maturation protein HypF
MAEHDLDGIQPIIGVCFDGTGYGTDGAIWGGEVLVADYAGFRRAAHLDYVPLPGGDAAVKHPTRVALAYLWAAGIDWQVDLPPVPASSAAERRVLARQFESGFRTVPSSSMGRLFDAVAALIGIRQTVNYEAQAAIELESIAAPDIADGYVFDLVEGESGALILDPAPVICAIVADIRSGVSAAVMAGRFHQAVATAVLHVCLKIRAAEGLSQVGLSGGVFQNIYLLNATVERLQAQGFTVLTHRQVPPNDGGLALGQAVLGAYALASS